MFRRKKILTIAVISIFPVSSLIALFVYVFSYNYNPGKAYIEKGLTSITIRDMNYPARYTLPINWNPIPVDKGDPWDIMFVSPDKLNAFRTGSKKESDRESLPFTVITYLSKKTNSKSKETIKQISDNIRYFSTAQIKQTKVEYGLYTQVNYTLVNEKTKKQFLTTETVIGVKRNKRYFFFNFISNLTGQQKSKETLVLEKEIFQFLNSLSFEP